MLENLWVDFVAGWLAGASGLIVGHPLDTIKVRWQTLPYNSVLQCARDTVVKESPRALYKGMLAPIMTTGLMNSMLFAGYSATLTCLGESDAEEVPFSHIVLASNVGSAFQFILAAPVDVIKVKLQIDKHQESAGAWKTARRIHAEHGIKRGLYRAGMMHFQRDMIGFNFYIPVYEYLYRHWREKGEIKASLAAGALAGIAGWNTILPWDVIKNRMQAQDWSKPIYTSSWQCAKTIYKEEGSKAFFKGFTVCALRAAPVNAVIFLVYSRARLYLDNLS